MHGLAVDLKRLWCCRVIAEDEGLTLAGQKQAKDQDGQDACPPQTAPSRAQAGAGISPGALGRALFHAACGCWGFGPVADGNYALCPSLFGPEPSKSSHPLERIPQPDAGPCAQVCGADATDDQDMAGNQADGVAQNPVAI